ncbi:MAG TPA: hypothetical protein VLZ74_08495, partial [Methylocella sp.]|nr:hypothetical protein [Methylocella sp.]
EPILRDVLADTFHDLPVDIKLDICAQGLSIDQMTAIVLLVKKLPLTLPSMYSVGDWALPSRSLCPRGRMAGGNCLSTMMGQA